jgi:hypothetical protein
MVIWGATGASDIGPIFLGLVRFYQNIATGTKIPVWALQCKLLYTLDSRRQQFL